MITSFRTRQNPGRALRLPDFFIVGAMKCGTTSLYRYLAEHSRIWLPALKEPDFFSKPECWRRGFPWYGEIYHDCPPDCLTGDASTSYSFFPQYPDAAVRLAESCPRARLIYLVRHPLERIVSQFAHWAVSRSPWVANLRGEMRAHLRPGESELNAYVRVGLEGGPSANLIAFSRYATQMRRYLEYFPREQILVVDFDRLTAARQPALDQVFGFLDLSPETIANEERHNASNLALSVADLEPAIAHAVMQELDAEIADFAELFDFDTTSWAVPR